MLHRIVKVREQDYLICGDNRLFREPVPERWILGVMTGFWNGDTFVDCKTDAGYRRYVEKLKYGYPLRWLRALPGRVLRKLRHIL